MNKVKDIFIIFLLFLFIYYVQINIFNLVTIAGVKPNLFIIFIFFIGVKYDNVFSLVCGLLIGLFLDLKIGTIIGINTIIFGLFTLFFSYISKILFNKNKFIDILILFSSTILLELLKEIFNIIIFNFNIEIYSLFVVILLEALYNILVFIIIYPIWKKINRNRFDDTNKLIRYL